MQYYARAGCIPSNYVCFSSKWISYEQALQTTTQIVCPVNTPVIGKSNHDCHPKQCETTLMLIIIKVLSCRCIKNDTFWNHQIPSQPLHFLLELILNNLPCTCDVLEWIFNFLPRTCDVFGEGYKGGI